jgi:hypothetical protein
MARTVIDTADWPVSGTATTSTTGFHDMDEAGEWVHGVDGFGRKYIENVDGSSKTIELIDPSTVAGDDEDSLKISAGIALIKQATLTFSATNVNGRLFDTSPTSQANRMVAQFYAGTNYFGQNSWRFELDGYVGGSTIDHNNGIGIAFGSVVEIGVLFKNSDSEGAGGSMALYVGGRLTGVSTDDPAATTFSNPVKWKLWGDANDEMRTRLYGDRNGQIVIEYNEPTTFSFEVDTIAEESQGYAFRAADIVKGSQATYWEFVSGEANVTLTNYASSGINPQRKRFVADSNGCVVSLQTDLERRRQFNTISVPGIMVDTGGSYQMVLYHKHTGDIIAVLLMTNSALSVASGGQTVQVCEFTQATKRYNLRINRASGRAVIGLEDMTNGTDDGDLLVPVTDAVKAQVAEACKGLVDAPIGIVTITASDCEFDGIFACEGERTGMISSYLGADISGLSPTQEMFDDVMAGDNVFMGIRGHLVYPGATRSATDFHLGPFISPLGRSGGDLNEWIDEGNASQLDQMSGGLIELFEWAVNSLSPVRNSESGTETMITTLSTSLSSLISACIRHGVRLRVHRIVGYPTGGSNDWQAYTLTAVAAMNVAAVAAVKAAGRPDLIQFVDVPGDVDDYFATDGSGGSTGDDIHFDSDGYTAYFNKSMELALREKTMQESIQPFMYSFLLRVFDDHIGKDRYGTKTDIRNLSNALSFGVAQALQRIEGSIGSYTATTETDYIRDLATDLVTDTFTNLAFPYHAETRDEVQSAIAAVLAAADAARIAGANPVSAPS